MDLLKLIALDQDDLEVVSAHLQDAAVRRADIHWRPAEQRLVIGLHRFDWEAAYAPSPQFRRRCAALRFDRVRACKARNIDPAKDQILNLLAIAFAQRDPPAGIVTLLFDGGGALRLEVECLEVELADLAPDWLAATRPEHFDPAA